MRLRSLTLLAGLTLALLAPDAASARFILLDADFDGRPVGSQLQRRGALFGEPIGAVGCEQVVADGPGDNSLLIGDSGDDDPCYLYWALRSERDVADGKLTVRLDLQPDVVDNYDVIVRDLTGANEFFRLHLDSANRAEWSDANTFTPVFFIFYTPGQLIEIVLEFNLDAGTYDFAWNGTQILDDEPHGIVGAAVARILAGAAWDTNASGALRLDNISVDWRPGTATPLLLADFDDKTVGDPIGVGGAAAGEPFAVVDCIATVRSGIFPSPSLEIEDDSDNSGLCRFGFLGDVEPDNAPLSISLQMAFDSIDGYVLYVRERNAAAQVFLTLNFTKAGTLHFDDEASGGLHYLTTSYVAGVPFRLEIGYEPAAGRYSVWIDNERIVHRRAHGVTTGGPGSLRIGLANDLDRDGRVRVDNLVVHTLTSVTPVRDPDLPDAGARPRLTVAPNPFNPRAEVSFALPAADRVRLEIFDARGRLVRQLLDGNLPAGAHTVTWDGLDDAGRVAASGVYRARLATAKGESRGASLTMVRRHLTAGRAGCG